MAQSEQQRQRKLAKKQAKNREKHKLIARKQQDLESMAGQMQASAKGEIIYCGVCESISDIGLGHVVIARQGPSRLVGLVMFLVDTGCLGVKDTVAALRGPSEVKEIIQKLERERELKPVPPELARGLVEGAVEYARLLGFPPHCDYRKASLIWGDIKPASIEGHYQFGRDGKPYYCNGPFENAARQQHILRTLERNVGENNFNFVLGLRSTSEILFEDIGNGDYVENDDEFEPLEVDVRRIDEPHT
jgi:hypothetical protein